MVLMDEIFVRAKQNKSKDTTVVVARGHIVLYARRYAGVAVHETYTAAKNRWC